MPVDQSFSCLCGKKYKWKPNLAGKKVRCSCGTLMEVPQGSSATAFTASLPARKGAVAVPATAQAGATKPVPPSTARDKFDASRTEVPKPTASKPAIPKSPSINPAATKPAPVEDDLYGFAEDDFSLGPAIDAPVALPRAAELMEVSSARSANRSKSNSSAAGDRTVAYARPAADRFSAAGLTDPARDLYVPAALLGAGFLGVVLWLLFETHLGALPTALLSLFVGIATAVKTAVIIGLALVFAPRIGISFGLLRTAILKFAAIIIFSDAVLLWVESILRANGGISRSGKTVDDIFWVILGVTSTVITASSYYLFNMDMEDIATFAIPMAIVSRVVGFVLNAIVVILITAVLAGNAAARRASSPPNGASVAGSSNSGSPPAVVAPPAPPMDETPVVIAPSATDREIAGRIKYLLDAQLWERRKRITDPRTSALMDAMYTAGAPKVAVELRPALKGTVGEAMRPGTLYVELPDTKGARLACLAAASEYNAKNHPDEQAIPTPFDAQYLVVNLIQ